MLYNSCLFLDDGGTYFEDQPNSKNSTLSKEDSILQTLIENNIIPEDEELANTLYSFKDDFELDSSSGSSIEEELPDDDLNLNDSEYRDMMGLMEQALDLEESTMSAANASRRNGLLRSKRRKDMAEEFKKDLDLAPSSSDSDEYDGTVVNDYDVPRGSYENENGTMFDFGTGKGQEA